MRHVRHICMYAYTEYSTDPRVRREAEALVERGDTVDFLCLRPPLPPKGAPETIPRQETIEGVRVYYLPMSKYQGSSQIAYMLSYVRFLLIGFWWINGMYFRNKYTVIHVHNMPDFLLFAAIIPRILGCRLILDMHDLTVDLYRVKFRSRWTRPLMWILLMQERWSNAMAHHVITVTEAYRQILIKRGTPPDKVSVLLNTPDDRIFQLDSRPTGKLSMRQVGIERPLILVYHGTIVPRYGLDILLKSVALIRGRGTIPNLQVRLYGKGEDLPRLRQMRHDLGLEDVVYIHGGNVAIKDLPQVLIECDIAVVPNLDNEFTRNILPTKLMEYFALGIPTIASKTYVVTQYCDDDMVCFIQPGSVEDLAQKIELLARDPVRCRTMARVAHQRFTRQYRWSTTKYGLYETVDAICERKQPELRASSVIPVDQVHDWQD